MKTDKSTLVVRYCPYVRCKSSETEKSSQIKSCSQIKSLRSNKMARSSLTVPSYEPTKLEPSDCSRSISSEDRQQYMTETLRSLPLLQINHLRRVYWEMKCPPKHLHPLHNVTLVTSPTFDDISDIFEEVVDLISATERCRKHRKFTNEE